MPGTLAAQQNVIQFTFFSVAFSAVRFDGTKKRADRVYGNCI
jgi:hypothetical protein